MSSSLPPDPASTANARREAGFETLCAHWGEDRAAYQGAVIPPIYQNSLFTYPDCETRFEHWGEPGVYDYTRYSNPTTDIVEAKIAALEGGEKARCFGSGMGAISAAIFSCVKAGDHIVCVDSIYGPTRVFLTDYLARFQVETTFVDGADAPEWEDACRPTTTVFMLESPSSMIMRQQDLAAVAKIAKARGISTICDNSWASPFFQSPLQFGIDLVVHSATKYLAGHSDVVAGVAVGQADRMQRMVEREGCLLGAVLDPFASWLLLRGIRTLPIRMERHCESARKIAHLLSEHPAVARVFYPGQPGDPQEDLTRRQLRGTSGLLSLLLKDNRKESVFRFVNRLKYFGIGCSWGGFESLVVPSPTPANRAGGSGTETLWLVRLHIGLETADDLWADLAQALGEGV
jgi:cystathionine beta-lyase